MKQEQLFNAGEVKIGGSSHRRGMSSAGMCREPGCTRRARQKQGARYCVEHARSIDRGPVATDNATFKVERECLSCGRQFRRWRQTRATSVTHNVCPDCITASPLSIAQLQAHCVPNETATKWLARGAELRCDYCDRLLYRKGSGPQIDHDHACCPGQSSCGKCIRGVLCVRCNTFIAHFENLVADASVERLLAYVSK